MAPVVKKKEKNLLWMFIRPLGKHAAFESIQMHQILSALSRNERVPLASESKVFNWMCYLLAAITVTPRGMDGDRKTDERRAMFLADSLRLWSLLCFLRATWLRRDWQRHDSGGKQKVLHVHREMSMEWLFENNKSQLAEKARCPEPHLNWITIGHLNVSFPVIKSDLDINNKVTKGICSASSCLKLLIDDAL